MSNLKIIKSFILAFLLILTSGLLWKGLADIYLHSDLSVGSLIWFSVSVVLFAIFFLLFSLLVDYQGIFFLIYLLCVVTFLIFFSPSVYSLIALAALLLAMVMSRVLIQKERNERLKISISSTFKSGLPWLLTILALFIGFLGYLYPLTPTDKNEINLPAPLLNLLVEPLTGTLSKTLPMLDKNTTIDQALAMNIAIQNIDLGSLSPELLSQLKDKNIKDLTPTQLMKDPKIAEILQNQAKKVSPTIIVEQRNNLAKSLNITLTGQEKMNEVINKVINAKIKEMVGPAIGILPFVSAIFIFVMLRLIFIPLGWLVVALALIVFHLLRIFKFVKIEKVMKEGEDVKI